MPAMDLLKRQSRYNDCSYDRYGNCYSTWDAWARWVVLGLIIFGALFIFFLFSCISARRRRKRGYAPFRGTGWAAGRTPPGHAPAQYNSAQPYYANQQHHNSNGNLGWGSSQQAPPPAYGASQGYYGNNRGEDVEMQPPQQAHVYGGESGGYAPPAGPPPGKRSNDGIVR